MAEHGPGDTQPLLLAAGDVGAALSHLGVEAVGEGHDEVVGLGVLGRLDHLLLGGVGPAPQEVLPDGAGEEDVVLEHHTDALAQLLQGVVPHVHPVQQHRTAGHVVETGDQVHQGGLSGAGAAHHGDELAGLDGEVNAAEHVLTGAAGVVLEVHVLELHLALGLGELSGGEGAVLDGGLRLQHLVDTAGAGNGPGELEEAHAQHHDAHEDLEDIGDEGGEVANEHLPADDLAAAQVEHRGGGAVHGHHHNGDHGDDPHIHVDGGLGEGVVGGFELGLLIALPDEGLHHTDGHQVLLDGAVEGVDALLEDLEEPVAHAHQDADGDDQQGDGHQHDHRQLGVDADGHCQGRHQHHRGADQHPQGHGHHHLDGVDVVGDAGDEGGRGEPVDVGEGEILHLIVDAPAQVGAEALTHDGGELGAQHTAGHAAQGQHQHDAAHLQNIIEVALDDTHIHDVGHEPGQGQLAGHLQDHEQGGDERQTLIPPHIGKEFFQHEQSILSAGREFRRLRSIRSWKARTCSISSGVKPSSIRRSTP